MSLKRKLKISEIKKSAPVKKVEEGHRIFVSVKSSENSQRKIFVRPVLLSIFTGLVVAGIFSAVFTAFAVPPTSKYDAGATLDPSCSAGDTNCSVVTPAQYSFSSNNFSGTGSFTTTNTITAGTLQVGSEYTFPTADGTNGQVLTTDGLGAVTWGAAGSSSPGGSDTQVQYNSSGSFAGSANLTFDGTTLTTADLSVGSLTGILKAAAGAFSVITNSSGLADNISDETGSGSLVFSASPSLSTPIISTSATFTDDAWLGLGSGKGHIEFDDQTIDEVNILGASVGIGTSTPTPFLQSNALTLYVANSNYPEMTLDHTDGTTTSSIGDYSWARDGDQLAYIRGLQDGALDAAAILFTTQATGGALTERMRITSGGNWGLGITPVSKAHIYENTNTITETMGLTIENDGEGDAALTFLLTGLQRWVMGIDNSSTNDDFIIADDMGLGATQRLVIDGSNGNVGIGAASSESILHTHGGYVTVEDTNKIYLNPNYAGAGDIPAGPTIYSDSSNLSFLPSSDGGVGDTLGMYAYTGSAWKSMVETANTTGGANPDVLLAKSGGNVGIGTTDPDRGLEINTGAATGGLRLTYNDADGSAATYSDYLVDSNGDVTFSAIGGDFSFSDDNITTTGVGTFGNQIKVLEGGASPTYYTIFQGGDQTGADITYTLPTSSATGLLKNTSGTLSWDTTAYTANTRNINTTSPLSGGGDLSSDRTLTVGGLSSLGTANYVVGVNSGASAWEYKNIVGTASEIDITHAEGSITIGLVDPLALSKGGTAKSLTASNGGIVYTDSDSMEVLSGTATANQMLMSGSSSAPSWSTATYPATTTANQLLYSSSNNVVAGLSSGNYGILNTGATGVPSITASPTISTSLTIGVAGTATGQLKLSGTTSGTVTLTPAAEAGTWTLTLPTNDGDVNQFLQTNGSGVTTWATDTGFANPMTTIGDIIYGGSSGTPTRLGTGTTGKILQANTGAAPSWSTATYPATTTANQILYSTGNNVVGASSNFTYSGTLFTVSGSGNGGYINITDEANGYQVDGLRVVTNKGSDGTENLFLGQSGNFTLTGTKNILAGYQAGQALTSGYGNQFIGYQAGYSTTTGSNDVFLGEQAGYSNTTGVANVFLGFQAGYYETGSNKLFIDNQKRTDEADARTKALIYGVFDSAVANQTLTVNGNTDFSSGLTTLNYGTDAPTLGTNGQLSVAYVGSSNRLYWYSNGGVHYVNATAGFEIPAHETIDPLSGDKIQIGDFVLGMVNANIGDKESANKSSLHGIWVKWDSLKTELINEIKNGIGLVPDGSWATGSPLDATAGLQGVDTSTMMERVTNTLTSLGISIKNGITNIEQLAVEKLTAQTARIQRLEMVDSATGEIYCTWIENGNWQKAEGDCASVKNTSAVVQTQQPQASTDEIKQAVKKEVKQEVKEELKPEIKGQVKSQIAEAEQQRAEEQQEEQQAASEVGPIVSFVSSIEDISVDFGTEMSSIALPASITATVSGADQELLINWNNGTPEYDPNTPETYQFSGTLGNLPDNVTNPDGLEASVNVIVGPAPEPTAQEEQPPAEQPTEDEVESVSDQESTSEKESKGKSQKSTENQKNSIEGATAALTAPIKKVVQESITGFISSISSFAKWSFNASSSNLNSWAKAYESLFGRLQESSLKVADTIQGAVASLLSSTSEFAKWLFNTSSSNLNSWAKAYESLFGRLQESSLKVADTIQGAVASLLSSTSEFAKWLFNISVSGLSNGFQDTSESIKEGLDKTPLLMETQTASVSKSFQNIWFLSKESINKLISLFGN